MSEHSHTKGDGNHQVVLETPLDSTSTAHDDRPDLAESTQATEKKATRDADLSHPNGLPTEDSHPGAAPPRANGRGSYTEAERQKMTSLIAKNTALAAKQADITRQHGDVLSSLRTRDPKALVGRHIGLLHEYNEVRDGGQKLMGMIAEERGVTAKEVYEEFGVGGED